MLDLIEKSEIVEKNLALIKEKASLLEDKKISDFYKNNPNVINTVEKIITAICHTMTTAYLTWGCVSIKREVDKNFAIFVNEKIFARYDKNCEVVSVNNRDDVEALELFLRQSEKILDETIRLQEAEIKEIENSLNNTEV